jgi:hypothetical protein
MVYIRLPSFKTGVSPSNLTRFNSVSNAAGEPQFTGKIGGFDDLIIIATQKLWLTRNRIWGNVIGGNERSGYKELKAQLQGPSRAQYYKFHDLRMIYPFVKNWEAINDKKIKF